MIRLSLAAVCYRGRCVRSRRLVRRGHQDPVLATTTRACSIACEEYRLAVERGDADALMLMAHKQYWED